LRWRAGRPQLKRDPLGSAINVQLRRPCALRVGAGVLLACLVSAQASGQRIGAERRDSSRGHLWRIIDSVRLEEHIIMYPYAYRIAVGHGPVDTIAGVLPPFPATVGDSLLIGLVYGPEVELIRFFRYHLANGEIEQFPIPGDVMVGYHDICVSPDGRHVAYEAWDSASHLVFAAVREWPAAALLIRGPELQAIPSDVDFAHARWLDNDRFEIVIEEGADYLWVLVSGRLSTRKYEVHKLETEPQWHDRGGNYCPGSSP